MIRTFAISALAWLVAGAPLPVLAETRALVVGVNAYAHKQQLEGSVADADDIAGVLVADGVTDLTKLTDAAATRTAFDAAWARLVAEARPGDLLFVSFSGHGIRVPQKPGDTPTVDGYEAGFLLQPYDEKTAPEQFLSNEYLYDQFALATARGAKVVFVADACHSGAAVRNAFPVTKGGTSFRFQTFDLQAAPVQVQAPAPGPAPGRPPNPDVTVFSATDGPHVVQEINSPDGAKHGALSYAVARGLSGLAADPAGNVTAESLHHYVSPQIHELAEGLQIPQFTIPQPSLVLAAHEQPAAADPFPAVPRDVSIAVTGPATLPPLDGAKPLEGSGGADLIWDSERQLLLSSLGDILVSGIDASRLQSAIDARRVLVGLQAVIAQQKGGVAMTATSDGGGGDDGQFYIAGHTATFTVDTGGRPYVTLFDLNAGGKVQFMRPWASLGDVPAWSGDGPFSFSTPVTPPFGADHVITILSRQPLDALWAQLSSPAINDHPSALAAYDTLRVAAGQNDILIGITNLFSCASLRSDGQCDTTYLP